MKILYFYKELQTVMSQWQRWHIVDELNRHGLKIQIFNPLTYASKDQANEEVLRLLQAEKFDLFMTPHNEEDLYISTLESIKHLGIPTMLICFDNLVIPFYHKNIAPLFDLVWLTSKDTEYLFESWGANTIFLPYAANPFFMHSANEEQEILKLGFIGTPHGSRIDKINALLAGGIPMAVHTKATNVSQTFMGDTAQGYAKTMMDYMKYDVGRKLALGGIVNKFRKRSLDCNNHNLQICDAIPLSDLARTNAQYALVLSFTEANSTGVLKEPVDIVNLRNFEIPMSGGIQFTRYSEEITSYFENDKEIVLYKDEEEMLDKARFYLHPSQDQTRKAIRQAARHRAENEHTWYCRFKAAFERLSLGNAGDKNGGR